MAGGRAFSWSRDSPVDRESLGVLLGIRRNIPDSAIAGESVPAIPEPSAALLSTKPRTCARAPKSRSKAGQRDYPPVSLVLRMVILGTGHAGSSKKLGRLPAGGWKCATPARRSRTPCRYRDRSFRSRPKSVTFGRNPPAFSRAIKGGTVMIPAATRCAAGLAVARIEIF